jgi:carboxymethylenebutenolidase
MRNVAPMSETLQLSTPDATDFDVYVSRPEGDPRGGIVLVHEIWGLQPHIRDVADRFAAEGYLVVAPDILSRAGVTRTSARSWTSSSTTPTRRCASPRSRACATRSRRATPRSTRRGR